MRAVDSGQSIHSLAERVRDARSRMRLTQAQFAERMAVTPLTVHRWETGQSRPRSLALDRLREVEESMAARDADTRPVVASQASVESVPLDFAGDPAAVLLVAEAYRLAHGHQFNAAFASETARIDPLPHQRIAVYERMLAQEPLRFLLADDAGAGKTIMTGLYIREMQFRQRIRRVLIVYAGRARGQLGTRAAHLVSAAMPPRIRSGCPGWCESVRGSEWRSGHRLRRYSRDRTRTFAALRDPECRAIRPGGVRRGPQAERFSNRAS